MSYYPDLSRLSSMPGPKSKGKKLEAKKGEKKKKKKKKRSVM